MFNFLKKQPVEFYILVIVPIIWITALIIFNPVFLSNLRILTLQSAGFYAFFGGPFFQLGFFILYNYLIAKACFFLKDLWQLKRAKQKISFAFFYPHLKSWALIFLPIGLAGFVNSLAATSLSLAPADKVAAASVLINQWDYKIFGVYTAFWIQQFSGWLTDVLLINAYIGLTAILPAIFLGLLIFKKTRFRQFMLAILIAPMLGYPFWYIWPAVSPNEMFRYNVTKTVVPANIQNEIASFSLTEKQKEFDDSIEDFWIDKTGNTFAVTAFPSMHAAWGIIAAYFGVLLWKPLAIILIPWAILNSLGAIYTFQHYGVDMILGTIVGILAIAIAIFLLRFEKKYLCPKPQTFLMIDTFQNDCRSFIKFLRNFFFKILKMPTE
ncbi:MAG: phosphatase PAP2 family protein [Patescibacteria group bacterium]